MILSLHRMDAEIQDFAYGEDDNGRLIGGKLADDVQSIYEKLYEEYKSEYGSTAKLELIQRVMEMSDDSDEIVQSKDFKKITKSEIFDIVSALAFCFGIIHAWQMTHPGESFR